MSDLDDDADDGDFHNPGTFPKMKLPGFGGAVTSRGEREGEEAGKPYMGVGRPRKFPNAEILLAACQEYIQWCIDNPLPELQLFSTKAGLREGTIPRMRAATLGGLCLFLEIDDQTWRDYRAKPEYSGVCTRVETAIREQKFSGAAAGFLNASIIARDLGLADKRELTGAGGKPVQVETTMSPREAAEAYERSLREGEEGGE